MNLIIFITILILLQGVAEFLDLGEKKIIVFEHTTDNFFLFIQAALILGILICFQNLILI